MQTCLLHHSPYTHTQTDRQTDIRTHTPCTCTHLIQEFVPFLSSVADECIALVMSPSRGYSVLLNLVSGDLDPGTIIILDLRVQWGEGSGVKVGE